MSIKNLNKACEILKDYSGFDPYILGLKRDMYISNIISVLNDFQVEYILKNYQNKESKTINKTVTVCDWYSEYLKDKWKIDFCPTILLIVSYIGETDTAYCCYVQYRKSIPPQLRFLQKKGIIGDFLLDDYHNIDVDFDRYDKLCKNKSRRIKEEQKEGIKFLLSRKQCILADDMGYGKTLEMSIAAFEGNFDSVLIICPASIKTNWKKELCYYIDEKDVTIIESFDNKTKEELEEFIGYPAGKSGKKREELLAEALENGKWQNNKYVIVNYDILDEFYSAPNGRSQAKLDEAFEKSQLLKYIKDRKSLIIVDEAHRLSNDKSIRYKVINGLIKFGKPHSLYLATGTPVTNNPQNLFCLLKLLNNPLCQDWKYYVERYCGAMQIPAKGEKQKWTDIFLNKVGKQNWYELTPVEKDNLKEFISNNAKKITVMKEGTNLDELKGKIQHIYLRRLKEDLETLPNKTIHELFYTLNYQEKQEYNRLWDEYEKAQAEENPDKELNKDLLEGAIYRRYLSNLMVPNTIKLVDSFIEKNEKVVIACCYDEELYSLQEYYGDKCVIYNGKMNAKQKDNSVKKFMEDENTMVFIGNIMAAGVGITLISSHILVFNNISYVPSDDLQMCDRVHRIGATHDVDIYYQIYEDTQYENMWNIVLKKTLMINQIIKKESDKK